MGTAMLAIMIVMVFVIGLMTGAVLMYEKFKPPVTETQEVPELDDFMKPIEEPPKAVKSIGATGYLLETKDDDSSRKYVCSKCGYSFWTNRVKTCPGCKAKLLGVHKYEELDADEYVMIFGGVE